MNSFGHSFNTHLFIQQVPLVWLAMFDALENSSELGRARQKIDL